MFGCVLRLVLHLSSNLKDIDVLVIKAMTKWTESLTKWTDSIGIFLNMNSVKLSFLFTFKIQDYFEIVSKFCHMGGDAVF